MENRVLEYRILSGNTLVQLQYSVDRHINNGFVPTGGIAVEVVNMLEQVQVRYYQAVILENREVKP